MHTTTSSVLLTSPFVVSSSLSSALAPHMCWRSSFVESVCAPSFLPLSLCVMPVLASRLLHCVTGYCKWDCKLDSAVSAARIWDVETTDIKATMEGHQGAVNAVAVNHNGSFCASGSNDKTCRQDCLPYCVS
eukprot:1140153-Pelagomonas_calceolata.AAC.3